MPIDYDEQGFHKDIAPFIVMEDTPMSKLHFLFIMLNISQVNIVKEGIITGIISKLEFLKKRKEEEKLMRRERRRRRFLSYFGMPGGEKPATQVVGLLDNAYDRSS
jgi:hypothetical protein